MTLTSSIHRFGLCVGFLLFAGTAGAAATPPQLRGTWEVTQVALDTSDQPHWRYEPNDPRLLGRILTVGDDGEISFNFKRERCNRVAWSIGPKTTIAALLAKSFPRPPRAGQQSRPTLGDFALQIPNHSFRPLRAVCIDADPASDKAAYWGDAWFAQFTDDKLLIGYDGDTVLVLKKARPGAMPAASFACRGALNPAEQAVCHSPVLAAFDRSVAAAYRRSLRRREGETQVAMEEQRAWLKERNACKSDPACLEGRMRDRIDMLMQD